MLVKVLNSKPDRTEYIKSELERLNIQYEIIEPIMDKFHAWKGVFKNIQEEITKAKNQKLDYVIIVEDDVKFIGYYETGHVQRLINKAKDLKADILFSGFYSLQNFDIINNHNDLLEIQGKMYGLQFTVYFKQVYDKILNLEPNTYIEEYLKKDDFKKLVCYPFLCEQIDFKDKIGIRSNTELFNNCKNKIEEYLNNA